MSGKNILVLSLFPFSSLNLYLLYHPVLHLYMYDQMTMQKNTVDGTDKSEVCICLWSCTDG